MPVPGCRPERLFCLPDQRHAFITTCHGYYSKHPFTRVMGWGKLVIVPSQAVGRHMIEDFGLPRERARFIPRSVDASKFTLSPGE